MYPKYIIVSQPKEMRGFLRLGWAINHKDLVIGYEKVHGGGWYLRDDAHKTITLYGSSGDYGEADFRFLDMIPKEFKDYTFIYTPFRDLPGNILDTSKVEWV